MKYDLPSFMTLIYPFGIGSTVGGSLGTRIPWPVSTMYNLLVKHDVWRARHNRF